MQWFKIDSLLADNEKWLRVDDPDAQLLWFMVGVGCSRNETDGIIRPHMLKRWATDAHITAPGKVRAARAKLIAARLWHDAAGLAKCDACIGEFGSRDDLDPDDLVMHNWADHNPTRDDKTDESRAFKATRTRQLKRLRTLKEQVRRRDRDWCRYCGIRINMSDHVSTEGGCLDHVDPDGPNSLPNLVRACRGCNIHRKGERTPAEAGMVMLPPPTAGVAPEVPAWRLAEDPFGLLDHRPKYPRADGAAPGTDPGPNPGPNPVPTPAQAPAPVGFTPGRAPAQTAPDPGPNPVSPSLARESVRSRVGLGSDPGSVRHGSEPSGTGRLGSAPAPRIGITGRTPVAFTVALEVKP